MSDSLFIPIVFTEKFKRPEIRRVVTVRAELTREDYARWISDVALDYGLALPEARAFIARRIYERMRFEAYRNG